MNYKKVIEDYENGTINREDWELTFDNDGGYWSYFGDLGFECGKCEECVECAEVELKLRKMNETYGTPNGYSDVVDIAFAAGINADWC